MPKTPPYMRFFPSDWLAGTAMLTPFERGVYITLCCIIFESGGTAPQDSKRLAMVCGCTTNHLNATVDRLVEQGKLLRDEDGLHNDRVSIELNHSLTRSQSASTSASRRWEKGKQKQQTGDANASATHYAKDANQNQNQREKKEAVASKKNRKGSRIPEGYVPNIGYAVQRGLSEQQAGMEGEKFLNYWAAQPGQRGVKLDWDATWRNWVINAIERGSGNGRRRNEPTLEDIIRASEPGYREAPPPGNVIELVPIGAKNGSQ